MSGPKIDHAELERRKREELERARQERLRKIKLASDELHKELSRNTLIVKNICVDHAAEITSLANRDELAFTLQRIKALKNEFTSKLHHVANVQMKTEPEDIILQCGEIKRMNDELEIAYKTQIADELKRIEEFTVAESIAKGYETFSRGLAKEKENIRIEDISFLPLDDKTEEAEECNKKGQEAVEEIKILIDSEYIIKSDKKELLEFLKSIVGAGKHSKTALKVAISEYDVAKIGILRRKREFEDLYLEYVAEYISLHDILEKTQNEEFTVRPKAQSQFESLNDIEREIAEIQKLACFEEEHHYIRTQIDEVMQLFGYSMCDSIVLDTTQKGHHYICQSLSDDTAIHVHVSEAKQLMMEIVATETKVGKSNSGVTAQATGNAELNDAQKELLISEQGRFCAIHPQISAELRNRGVILTEKVHRKPDPKYCKKIINFVSEEETVGAQRTGIIRNKKKRKELTIK